MSILTSISPLPHSKDEVRVLAAAVQDMDGVTLDNDTEEALAHGDFDPVSAQGLSYHSLIKRASYPDHPNDGLIHPPTTCCSGVPVPPPRPHTYMLTFSDLLRPSEHSLHDFGPTRTLATECPGF